MAEPTPTDEYIGFERAEVLEIEFEGPPLDAYSLALLNFTLHSISNRVALLDGRVPEFPFRRFRRFYPITFAGQPQVVRLRVEQISSGSLQEVVTLLAAAIFTNDGARAILQNLSANIIWAIANSGLRGLRSRQMDERNNDLPPHDPYDIGPELAETIRHLSNTNRGKRCKLRLRSKRPNGDVHEVEIDYQPLTKWVALRITAPSTSFDSFVKANAHANAHMIS